LATTSERLRDLTCLDPRAATELTLTQAGYQASLMNYSTAAELGERVFADQTNSMSQRMQAAVVVGLSRTCLGASEDGEAWFLRARRCAGERGGISTVKTVERLQAATWEIIAASIAGTDLTPSLTRLGGEVDAAARQGDPETTSVAGLVLACAYAAVGEASKAARELEVAVRRARPPAATDLIPLAQIAVTRVLALAGDPDEARAVLDRIDPAALAGWPSLAHARHVSESYVLAAQGRHAEALAAAKAAASASVASPALLARDLYQMAVLGETEEAVTELTRLAELSDTPSTRRLSDAASSLQGASGSEFDIMSSLRTAASWGLSDDGRLGIGIAHERRLGERQEAGFDVSTDPTDLELTRREREIALLVAEGLGNREIAERLYLSVRTVESHVYQARAKVGARSRAELGRTVAPSRRAAGMDRARTM
jgi:DNA-binding CsgD family transcriptional regulator